MPIGRSSTKPHQDCLHAVHLQRDAQHGSYVIA